MATYAVGDIQGCFRSFERLLARIEFDRRRDHLWLVGDLVNRGPRSLRVLRFAADNDDRVTAVLGNHDLHLIAVHAGLRKLKGRDTLRDVLDAKDCDDLVAWLRRRPLLHEEDGFLMVHAGLHPSWNAQGAAEMAREAEGLLRGRSLETLLDGMRDEETELWRFNMTPLRRAQATLRVLLTARACDRTGRLCDYSGTPEDVPRGFTPWFSVAGRRSAERTVIFGHWAALGLRIRRNLWALDSGCVWGKSLSAIRLEDRAVFQVDAAD